MGPTWGILGQLGAVLGQLGAILRILGAILGQLRALLWPSGCPKTRDKALHTERASRSHARTGLCWGLFWAPSGLLLGAKMLFPPRRNAHFRILGHLGGIFGHLGGILGASCAILGACWPFLGHLGLISGPPWGILGQLGAILGPFWGILAPTRPKKTQQQHENLNF